MIPIHTSYVTNTTFGDRIKLDLLPIFCIKSIYKSETIGKYSGTCIHFPDLAPSYKLSQDLRNGSVQRPEFEKSYLLEIGKIDIPEFVNKIQYLGKISGAKGIILYGYGKDTNYCHRTTLAGLLCNLGLVNYEIKEYGSEDGRI